jgi:hypothetical protein
MVKFKTVRIFQDFKSFTLPCSDVIDLVVIDLVVVDLVVIDLVVEFRSRRMQFKQ